MINGIINSILWSTSGGEITIRVEKRTAGQAVINAIEFEWS